VVHSLARGYGFPLAFLYAIQYTIYMSLTLANAIKQIEKLEADKKKLTDELTYFKRSPYYLSYVTVLNQVNSFSLSCEKALNINDPENKEAFNMRWKFINELPTLLVNIDALREKMTPEEQKKADKLREDSMVEGMAEKHKRNGSQ